MIRCMLLGMRVRCGQPLKPGQAEMQLDLRLEIRALGCLDTWRLSMQKDRVHDLQVKVSMSILKVLLQHFHFLSLEAFLSPHVKVLFFTMTAFSSVAMIIFEMDTS